MVASGSADCTIKLWDAKTSLEVHTLEGHSNLVNSVAFLADSLTVASGSADCTIKLWDAKTGLEVRTLEGHSGSVQSVAFSADSLTVASGSYDRMIKLWDAKTGLEVRTLQCHRNWVRAVAFSADGTNFLIAVDKNWVFFAGERVLWLPSYHRHFTCSSTLNGTLALGYGDGRVSVIEFDPPFSTRH
ncbi:WD40-repeat-containing domain protein [Aspergillus keveii]|uniref:Mitochondrial division protein 1 n=1 Tax=Aspergillus keveii TaxID=714993 RepID=A0ABR4FHA1_9EURO